MSFINLMGSDVWSAADIVRRTEAELHGQVSKMDELILSRKMIGYSLGLMIPSAKEAADLTLYETAAYQAQESGIAAHADMALLQSALDYEAALRRLALPLITGPATIAALDADGRPITIANPALAVDAHERTAARDLLDAAGAETLDLVALRNPPAVTESEAISA